MLDLLVKSIKINVNGLQRKLIDLEKLRNLLGINIRTVVATRDYMKSISVS